MASRAVTWEVVVVITLFMSWVGCYFCRSHLFAVEPAFLEDSQLSSSQFGLMMAGGYAMYPTGKLLWGFVTDRFGGRVSLFSCILGTAAASAFFATGSSYGWYFVGWLLLRALQPAGWIGLVKLCGPWVPYQRQSRVLGFLSLSMMAGDVVARETLAGIISSGVSWSGAMYISAAITAAFIIPAALLLRPDPSYRGLPLHPPNPASAFSDSGVAIDGQLSKVPHAQLIEEEEEEREEDPLDTAEGGRGAANAAGAATELEGIELQHIVATPAATAAVPARARSDDDAWGAGVGDAAVAPTQLKQTVHKPTFKELFLPLARTPMFQLICVLSLLLTTIRETFLTFSAAYIESIGASETVAAAASAVVPLCGVPSVLIAGYLNDKLSAKRRGIIVPAFLLPAALGLLYIGVVEAPSIVLTSIMLGLIGFSVLGPYSLLAGTFALELGGDRAAGVATSVIDACGYVGACIMMLVRAADLSFPALFRILLGILVVSLVTGMLLWRSMRIRAQHS